MLKAQETSLSRNWVVRKRHGASYTGGPVCLTADGAYLACMASERVALLALADGTVSRIIPDEVAGVQSEAITAFATSPTAPILVTCSRNQLLRVWDTNTGVNLRFWKAHKLPVLCAEFEQSGTLVATGGSDRVVMVWDVDKGYATHSFRGHEAIISAIKFMPNPRTVQRLVSGSEDGQARVWDLMTQACLAVFTEHYSSITSIAFSPDAYGSTMLLAGRDRIISVWDAADIPATASAAPVQPTAKATVPVMETVEAAVMLPAADAECAGRNMHFFTAGDGGSVRKWNLTVIGGGAAGSEKRYACVQQSSASVAELRGNLAPGSGSSAATKTRGADAETPVSRQFSHLILRKAPPRESDSEPTAASATTHGAAAGSGTKRKASPPAAAPSPAGPQFEIVAVTRDHMLTLMSAASLRTIKTIVGFNDEVIDLKYVPRVPEPYLAASGMTLDACHPMYAHTHVVMATNSEQLRLMRLDNFDARLLDGHADTILSVSVSPDGTLAATASKDRTARVWDLATGVCLAVCEGHTEAVSSVAWPARASQFVHATASLGGGDKGVVGTQAWLATASKDRTLKVWQMSALLAALPSPRPANWSITSALAVAAKLPKMRTAAAIAAHDKDVNAIAVSPNDRLLATGSQDKTIKLWLSSDLKPVAVMRGHKRGIWALAFSPVDQVLASSSADRTIRLWSVAADSGYACLRTFEGHDASVLNVRFIRRGTQLMSAGADGLVKLWNVTNSECVNTFDAHSQKVWALAVRPLEAGATGAGDEYETEIVTGGADSVVNVWQDVTASEAADEIEATEEALLRQQSLFTAMATRDYHKAIELTLELHQPGRCGDILQELLEVGRTPATSLMTPAEQNAKFAADMMEEIAVMQAAQTGSVRNAAADARVSKRADGEATLVSVLHDLSLLSLGRLLTYVREWNTQSRHGLLAQHLIHLLLKNVPVPRLTAALAEVRDKEADIKMIPGVGAIYVKPAKSALSFADTLQPIVNEVEKEMEEDEEAAAAARSADPGTAAASEFKAFVTALLPYSDRHYERLDRVNVSAYLVDYTLASMQVLAPGDAELSALGLQRTDEGFALAATGRPSTAAQRTYDDDASSEDEDGSEEEGEEETAAGAASHASVRTVRGSKKAKISPAAAGVLRNPWLRV